MTRFICQELLYEFVSGNLDLERQKAVDVYLGTCRESQHELERLKRGLHFSQLMSRVHASPDLHAALLGFEPGWKRRLSQWTKWWSDRGWRALPYAFVIATLVMGMIVFKPWQIFTQKEMTLVEQQKTGDIAIQQPSNPAGKDMKAAPAESEGEGEEGGGTIEPDSSIPAVPPPEPAPAAAAAAPQAETVAAKPSPLIAPEKAAASEKLAAPAAPAADKPAEAIDPERKAVYRGHFEVKDFAIVVDAIKNKIPELDGKQIGGTAFGTIRADGQAYFRFSIPQSNREDFETFLKTFGPVQFSKATDKRVMPEGENQIILTVKDGDPHEDGKETETP